MKNSGQIAVHLPPDYAEAVRNLADAEDLSSSEWVRRLINRELKAIYLQAKHTLDAFKHLENDGIFENDKNGANCEL